MHSVASPFFDFLFCISCNSVTKTLAPEAPLGCPKAIAPPLTLTIFSSKPSSLFTEIACAAKASFECYEQCHSRRRKSTTYGSGGQSTKSVR